MLPIALALAQFAPSLIGMLTGSEKAATVAQQVVGIAQTVTGMTSPETALTAIQADPAKALEFQQAVMANDADLQKAYLADTAGARARDVDIAKAGVFNYRANSLAAGAGFLVVFCLALVVWRTDMDDNAKAVITLILGRALGWIEQIFSFEFGTTRANKTKDDTINNLTK